MARKRTKILTNEKLDIRIHLPWDEDPTEARRIYQRLYREAHKSDPVTAIAKELGINPRKKQRR